MPTSILLRPLFDQTVTVVKRTSTHSGIYPKPGYQTTSAGRSFPAHIEESEVFLRTETGHETVGGWKVFLYSSTAFSATSNYINTTDRVIMPDGYTPATPQIISSRPVSDENGVGHWVLKLRR